MLSRPLRSVKAALLMAGRAGGCGCRPLGILPLPLGRVAPRLLHVGSNWRLVDSSSRARYIASSALKQVGGRSNGALTTTLRTVHTAHQENARDHSQLIEVLMDKLEEVGIEKDGLVLGQNNRLLCPRCEGGSTREMSLSVLVHEEGNMACWNCFRAKCGWAGKVTPYAMPTINDSGTDQDVGLESLIDRKPVATAPRVVKEEDLKLEPLCTELVEYFAERNISPETLRRNYVMQRTYGNQVVLAFAYRRNGVVVGCKYRTVDKKFWQEGNTEKIFYGLDDIQKAQDIIIVEGEFDKLAMEEAGFLNCISAPDGAPPAVSDKIPDQAKLG